MYVHGTIQGEGRSRSKAAAQATRDDASVSAFVDSRPQALVHTRLQALADSSAQIQQLKALHGLTKPVIQRAVTDHLVPGAFNVAGETNHDAGDLETIDQPMENGAVRRHGGNEVPLPRTDKRIAAAAQSKWQSVADHSLRVMQAATIQKMAAGHGAHMHLPLRRSVTGNMPVQRVRVHRWMNADDPKDYVSKLYSSDPKAYAEMYRKIRASSFSDIVKLLDSHVQGIDKNSPFVSVARNPYSLAMSGDTDQGGVNDIMQKALHVVMFDVAEDLILPGISELAQSETELLILLKPGDSLQNNVVHEGDGLEKTPMVARNPWFGLSMAARKAAIQQIKPALTKLIVQEAADGTTTVRTVPVEAPWNRPAPESVLSSSSPLVFDQLPQHIQQKCIAVINENLSALGKSHAALASGSSSDKAFLKQTIDEFLVENQAHIRKLLAGQ